MARTIARCCLVVLGLLAVGWAVTVLPTFWRQQELVSISNAIERGNRYDTSILLGQMSTIRAFEQSGSCNLFTARAGVTVLVAILADADLQRNKTVQDTVRERANASARALVKCSPSDAFGWLVLFWLGMSQNGYTTEYGNYLRLSYEASPNEAAVALWRNRIVMPLFERLPSDITRLSVAEFVKLVETERLYSEMADVFEQVPPEVQAVLTRELAEAQKRPREVFARLLYERGVRATIPNTTPAARQPWN